MAFRLCRPNRTRAGGRGLDPGFRRARARARRLRPRPARKTPRWFFKGRSTSRLRPHTRAPGPSPSCGVIERDGPAGFQLPLRLRRRLGVMEGAAAARRRSAKDVARKSGEKAGRDALPRPAGGAVSTRLGGRSPRPAQAARRRRAGAGAVRRAAFAPSPRPRRRSSTSPASANFAATRRPFSSSTRRKSRQRPAAAEEGARRPLPFSARARPRRGAGRPRRRRLAQAESLMEAGVADRPRRGAAQRGDRQRPGRGAPRRGRPLAGGGRSSRRWGRRGAPRRGRARHGERGRLPGLSRRLRPGSRALQPGPGADAAHHRLVLRGGLLGLRPARPPPDPLQEPLERAATPPRR